MVFEWGEIRDKDLGAVKVGSGQSHRIATGDVTPLRLDVRGARAYHAVSDEVIDQVAGAGTWLVETASGLEMGDQWQRRLEGRRPEIAGPRFVLAVLTLAHDQAT